MADTSILILPAKTLEAPQTTQYTAGSVIVIDFAIATNTGATNAALSVNLVPVSGVAGAGNLAIKTRAIAPGETYLCPELQGQVLRAGDFISTLASGTVTMRVSGREVA